MKRKMMLALILVITSIILISCGSNADPSSSEERVFLNVTSGSNTASAYAFSSSIAKIVADNHPEINLTVQASGGGKENLSRIVDKTADIGVVYGPDILSAINGLSEYEGQESKYTGVKGLFAWPYSAVQVIVREDSGIDSIEDLKGKKIAIGAPGSTGSTFVWPYVLPEFGVTEENSKWEYLSQSAAAEALGDGAIDALTALLKSKEGSIETLSLNKKIKMLEIPDPQREKIIENSIGLLKAEQDPKLYGDNQVNEKTIPTLGMMAAFVVREDVPEEVVYKIVKALFENLDEFHQSHASSEDIQLETAIEGMPVPLHPGAEKYFKEVGIIK